MKIGIIGVGHLAGSILSGLLRSGIDPANLILSARGRGAELAEQHGFELASDNDELVSETDIILLSVRPGDAQAAVQELPWRESQVLMSACAGVSILDLADLVAPATVVRIMPITAAELGASPTIVYPMVPDIQPFLEAIGSHIVLDNERQFETASVSAAIYGWVQALIKTGTDWSVENGLDPDIARQLMAKTIVASGRMQGEKPETMEALIKSLCTPGGITEAGLAHLETKDVANAWEESCSLVLRKLQGKPDK